MPNPITQDEINSILWKACDTFRGTVDPSEYKNYILVMLFVKYISDVWQDHYDAYRRQFSDDATRIERKMRFERFVLPAGCRFVTNEDRGMQPETVLRHSRGFDRVFLDWKEKERI